jgi:hypothetical protein
MNCQEYRDRVTVHLVDGSEATGEHGETCAECGRYAERARAAWVTAGRLPDEAVPADLAEKLMRSCRRPRRADLTLLRPGLVAAAAVLAVGALLLFLPESAGPGLRPMMDPDGMSVERYELPAGVLPAAVAEELRRKVSPEAWAEGIGGLEVGDGFLRVRGPAELQRSVREFLRRDGK